MPNTLRLKPHYLHLEDIPQTPNREDKDWAQFMQGLALHPIHNNETFSQQGGQNYTSTSLIDGFYTNIPLHTLPKCQTLTNQNQNSNHYPVSLTLNFVQLAQNHTNHQNTNQKLPTQSPKKTYKHSSLSSKKPPI